MEDTLPPPTVDTVEDVQPYLRDHEERITLIEKVFDAKTFELARLNERLLKLEKRASAELPDDDGTFATLLGMLRAVEVDRGESPVHILSRIIRERDQLLAKAAR